VSCDFGHDAGPYVIGALSPDDRLAYEHHLSSCDSCAHDVRALAGIPGLLARVDEEVLTGADVEVVPPTLLPRLAREVRRNRRRQLRITAAVAAAVAVAISVPFAAAELREAKAPPSAAVTSTPPTADPTGVPMLSIGRVPVRANLDLESVRWGTRLHLECTYARAGDQENLPHTVTYAIQVQARDGHSERIGTWRSVDGMTVHLTAGTAIRLQDIASVEVLAPNGMPVLRLRG
jgi:hypothetical protein